MTGLELQGRRPRKETITVVLPWAGSCEHRRRARNWVRSWDAHHFPTWEVVIARGSGEPWCKAAAAMPAIEAAQSGTIVLADADVFCRGLGSAAAEVLDGRPWAVPHDRVVRLDQDATEQLLNTGAPGTTYAEAPYAPMIGGGIVVASRDALLEAPLDRRFTGWGQEDDAHGRALRCLFGEPWRGTAELVHLWHPPQPRQSRAIGSEENWALRRRYRRARNDAAAMRELLQEAG